jgi:hypothetical protein
VGEPIATDTADPNGWVPGLSVAGADDGDVGPVEADSDLLETVKRAAVELKRADIPFALCGGWAVYARGGPRSEHDADFALCEQDVPRALDVLEKAGFRIGDPPEDWLAKVYDGGNLVDLIHRLSGEAVTAEMVSDVEELEVGSVRMPVLDATDLITAKLLTYRDHYCDFGTSLPSVRALREQVDWPAVRRRTADSPFAEAFLLLADRLGLTDAGAPTGRGEEPADG